MAAFDAFALSSTYEGLPIALVEAMAHRLPGGGDPASAAPRRWSPTASTVCLVPPRDPVALAAGLARLLGDPDAAGQASERRPRPAAPPDFDIRDGGTRAWSRSTRDLLA